jgi:hypothetical protein
MRWACGAKILAKIWTWSKNPDMQKRQNKSGIKSEGQFLYPVRIREPLRWLSHGWVLGAAHVTR